ncbi:ankyrin repeat domain-containing protein [Actinoplanes regularis]|uniref:ankyrin repeat domain-containing protein n=1 Tax=Actinoplanes regularis TaxID=52697 RepID=UPI002552B7C7|nr:ankyrin repeat domain-containing protein [Actinoplanes regularis]
MDLRERWDREQYATTMAYASPAGMIRAATAARLAGDWRAACAAAAVDVHVDLRDARARFGADAVAMLEADLSGLAPDLLRRHLPRNGVAALVPGMTVVLSRWPEPFRAPKPVRVPGRVFRWPGRLVRPPGTPALVVSTPSSGSAAQRLALRVADVSRLSGSWLDLPAWAWHAGAVAERRWAYGASEQRLPWHHTDGTPYHQEVPPSADRDRAAEFERLLAATVPEKMFDLFRSAGIEAEARDPRFPGMFAALQDRLPALAAEARRLAHRYGELLRGSTSEAVAFEFSWGGLGLTVPRDGSALRAGWDGSGWADRAGVAGFGLAAPRDVALLRWGVITPDQLHPLVHEALFPGRTQDWQPIVHDPYPRFRVRCGTEWHWIEAAGASVHTRHHDDAEAELNGCARALIGFRTGGKGVPKEIRRLRRRIFARALHGDTEGVLIDVDAGCEPGLRDEQGRTLLHWLAHLDHERVLPVLLAGGLSLEARDHDGRTPLHAAAQSAAEEVMAALVAAGARADVQDSGGRTAAWLLARAREREERH